MKQVSEMPTSGQFVAVWVCDGEIWSEVFINQGEYMDVFSNEDEEFHQISMSQAVTHLDLYSAQFFIAE